MTIQKGSVVRALAGRDKDGFFVVLGVEDSYALIADGKGGGFSLPSGKN